MNQGMIQEEIKQTLEREGFEGNPFLSGSFWSGVINRFGVNEKLIKYSSQEERASFLLLVRKSLLVVSSFLPSQAQLSLTTYTGLKPSLLKRIFSDNPVCLKLDLLSLDSKYIPETELQWPCMEISHHATTFSISLSGSFDDYWKARSKKLRNNIKRYNKRLEAEHPELHFRVISEPVGVREAVARYGILESKGWKGMQGTSLHPDNMQGKFYSEFLSDYSGCGQAVVYELLLGDALVASRICVVSKRMMIMLKTTYDETFKSYAPGRVLLYKVLQNEFNVKRTKALEFYTNATKDQLSWATDQRSIYHVTFYRNKFVQYSYNLLRKIKNSVTNKS